ncbi:hypothetical protein H6F42_16220 [Pseudanabaena sp. FACHB-1998]|uniref:hypothetical protein n=1 Tax=Pseudanabaena sp. FACHB-1998 TaxID=2692858 RepID=UPI0016814973|nr:hypothetical protein [Pseudanabaena sp. FACHB-1998]MBD2178465.1 hypothetical protein [Pseudanabaena sp. FACHB-1998]
MTPSNQAPNSQVEGQRRLSVTREAQNLQAGEANFENYKVGKSQKVAKLQKPATMLEFVILLILGLSVYTGCHLLIPSNSSLSSFKRQNDKIRAPILEEIGLMKEDIKNKESTVLSLLNQTETTRSTGSSTGTAKDASSSRSTQSNADKVILSLNTSTERNLLAEKTAKRWQDDLSKSNISNKEKRIIEDLSLFLKEIESKDLKKDNIQENIQLLINTSKSLANLESSLENSLEQNLFWTGNGKWLEVVFWSFFGTLLYIIQQTAEYHLSSGDKQDVKVLVRRKPQYYYFLLQSPFTALVILWVLSMANLNIAGIALALSSVPSEVLISLAFILGLFNRVANTQLNMIVAGIFGDAWKKTVRKIEIQKCEDENEDQDNQRHPRKRNLSTRASIEVYCGDCTDFEVLPDVKVKWSIESKPSAGIIDISTGTYIAPPRGFYYEDSGLKPLKQDNENYHNYTQDIIKAVREDEPNVSALVLVSLVDQAPKE